MLVSTVNLNTMWSHLRRSVNAINGILGAIKNSNDNFGCLRLFSSQQPVNFPGKKIDIEGMSLHYKEEGSGTHPVLLLPGIIGSFQTDFTKLFETMNKKSFRLVSWDPPGYGWSRPPDRNFRNIFYLRDAHTVAKMMKALGYDRYSILGWSNGGVTGAHLAAEYPERVISLVTWGAHAYSDDRAVAFSRMLTDLDAWSDKMKAPMLKLYGEEYLRKLLLDWADSVEEYHNNGDDRGFREGLPNIKCPALIIHGEQDPILGVEHAEFIAKHIQNSRLFVMPKAKHNLHLTNTDQFLQLVEDFLHKSYRP